MKSDNRKFLKIYYFISLAVILAFGIINSVFVLFHYDTDVHYFETGFAGYRVLYIAMGVFAVITLAISLVLARKEKKMSDIITTPVSSLFAMITGFLIAGSGIINLLRCFDSTYKYSVFKIGLVFISIICSVYFIYIGITKRKTPAVAIPFGCINIIWFCAMILEKYFEMDTPLNSPMRVFNHIMMLGAVIFLVQEIRVFFKINIPVLYYAFGIIGSMVLFSYSLADVLMTVTGKIQVSGETIYHCAFLILSMYILARVGEMLFYKESAGDKEVIDEQNHVDSEVENMENTEDIIIEKKSVDEILNGQEVRKKPVSNNIDIDKSINSFIGEVRDKESKEPEKENIEIKFDGKE